MSGFIDELRRRHVLRVGAAYAVASWLILQSVDVIFPILELDESLGRPILAILVVCFPLALIIAWFFEITPEGIKRDKEVSHASLRPTGRTLDRIIIVILVLAIGLLLVDRFVLQDDVPPQTLAQSATLSSVAVLPFANTSGDPENDYFSNGLTETLLHMLAQLPEIKVPARTSVFAFKDRQVDVREVGESLGVDTVLEGSVQRSGNTVRIRAQLSEAKTGFTLWSQTFDRNIDDIFAVQDEIATNVAGALERTLLGADATLPDLPGIATNNAAAYEKYLLALEQKNIASYSSLPMAEGLFKEALSIDPGFTEATVELANTYILQAETGIITSLEAQQIVRSLLDPVLEVDPENGRALGMVGALDWRAAIETFGPAGKPTQLTELALRHANELAPNDTDIYASLSFAAAAGSRDGEALTWIEQGLERDPLSARLLLSKGRLLLNHLEEPDAAADVFEKAREAAPQWTAAVFASGDAEFARRNYGEGVSWYLRSIELDPQDHELPALLARYYYFLDLPEEADLMRERAQALAPNEPWSRIIDLESHVFAGNTERAAILAEQMIRDDVENRGNAFNNAVIIYASSMLELGRAAVAVEFFETLYPGIGSPEYIPRSAKETVIQFVLIHLFIELGSIELAAAIGESLIAFADEIAPGWRDNDYMKANIAIAQGDMETAVKHAIDDLSRPFSENMDWRYDYELVHWMQPLVKNEEVAAKLDERRAETQQAGDEVRQMLAQRAQGGSRQ